jgi:DNA repair protein RadC
MEKLLSQITLFEVAEITVSYQPKFKASERPTVSSSKDVYNFFFHKGIIPALK